MPDRLVCLCNFIEKKEIIASLKKGALSTSDIQIITHAGTNCGKCLPEIDTIVYDFLQSLEKEKQFRIKF
jgi:nitrite reductase (NADH) large subunit